MGYQEILGSFVIERENVYVALSSLVCTLAPVLDQLTNGRMTLVLYIDDDDDDNNSSFMYFYNCLRLRIRV